MRRPALAPWIVLAAGLLLGSSCGRSRPRLDAAITPSPDAQSLEDARTMDGIDQLIRSGDDQRAQQALDQAFARGFSHIRAFLLQAKLFARRGGKPNLEQALVWLQKAIDGGPGWYEPRLMRAEILLRLERLDEAEAIFVEFDRLLEDHAFGPWGLAYVALHRGNLVLARRHLERALQRQTNHSPSLDLMAHLARQEGRTDEELAFLKRYLVEEPLDAGALLRLGTLYEQLTRYDDARRSYELAWRLQPDPAVARALANLATRLGQKDEAARWQRLAE